jgi:hypothetical protein
VYKKSTKESYLQTFHEIPKDVDDVRHQYRKCSIVSNERSCVLTIIASSNIVKARAFPTALRLTHSSSAYEAHKALPCSQLTWPTSHIHKACLDPMFHIQKAWFNSEYKTCFNSSTSSDLKFNARTHGKWSHCCRLERGVDRRRRGRSDLGIHTAALSLNL